MEFTAYPKANHRSKHEVLFQVYIMTLPLNFIFWPSDLKCLINKQVFSVFVPLSLRKLLCLSHSLGCINFNVKNLSKNSNRNTTYLALMHSERPKLHAILVFLSAMGLKYKALCVINISLLKKHDLILGIMFCG